MKKKALSLLLALVMCLGLATSAMAESSTGNWNDTDAITVDCVEYRDFFILYHHPTFEGEYAYMEPPVTIWMLNPDNLTFSTAGKASDYTVEYFVRGDTPELGDNGNYLYDGKGNVRLSELNGSFANLEKLAGVSMDKILMFVCDSDDFNVNMGWWMAPGSIGAIDMNTMKLGIYSVDAPKVIDPNVGLPAIRSYTDAAFTDVANDWTREGIVNSYELGLMSGVSKTQFSPGGSLTIAEGLTAAGRVFNLWHGGDGVLPQSGATWYDGAVEYAIENGIITRGQFESYDVPATRAQLAGILAKALPKEDYAPINSITSLPDVTADTPYSADIFTLYNAGILTGTDKYGTFHPDAPITRAEVAALLCRLVKPATRKTVTLEELPANRP